VALCKEDWMDCTWQAQASLVEPGELVQIDGILADQGSQETRKLIRLFFSQEPPSGRGGFHSLRP
jgi:hypothetical protein